MKIKFLLLSLSVFALAFAPVAKKTNLDFKLEKDKTYSQLIVTEVTTKQSIQGMEQIINQSASSEMSMKLTDEEKDANTYTMWYENITMSVEQMGMKQEFTSDTSSLDQVDPMSQIFAGLTNKEFSANIDLKGNILKIDGIQEIITNSLSAMGEQASMIRDQISSGFGEPGIKTSLEMFTAIMPADAVAEGSTWTNTQTSSSGLPVILRNTYTIKSINKEVATIEVNAEIAGDPANSSTEIQGMKASYFLEGDRTGTFTMEVKTGFVTNAEITDEIVGSITLESSPQMPEGMTIPIEMNSVTKLTSK